MQNRSFVIAGLFLTLSPIGAFAAPENVFVSLENTGAIDEVSPAGNVSNFATVPGHPYGMVFDKYGNLFVATYAGTSTIYEISPSGAVSIFSSGLHDLTHLAFDNAGNLYASDEEGEKIDKITPAGVATTFATLPNNYEPEGLAFDSSGNLYCATLNNGIEKITPKGVVTAFIEPSYLEDGIAFDSMDNLYVADDSDNVNKITPAGGITNYASGVFLSNDLAFDASGNLFVTSPPNPGRIYEVDPSGDVSTIVELAGNPTGIAIFVPEPSTALPLLFCCVGSRRRKR